MLIRIAQIWERLSLRKRLMLPLGTMFVAALLVGAISLHFFATTQLIEENEPPTRATRLIAEALNSALGSSNNPEQTLNAFGQSLGTSEAIQFRRTGTDLSLDPPVDVRTLFGRVPSGSLNYSPFPRSASRFPS
jgi:two-component system, NarL family, sensor histidine kinase UhpB